MNIVFLLAKGSSSYGDIFTSLNSWLRLPPTLIGQSTLFRSLSLSRKSQPQKLLHCLWAIYVSGCFCVCVFVQRKIAKLVIVGQKEHTGRKWCDGEKQYTLYTYNKPFTWCLKWGNIETHQMYSIGKWQTFSRTPTAFSICIHAHRIILSFYQAGLSDVTSDIYKSWWLDQVKIYWCQAPACSGSIYDDFSESEVTDQSYDVVEMPRSFSPFYPTLLIISCLIKSIKWNESNVNGGVKK